MGHSKNWQNKLSNNNLLLQSVFQDLIQRVNIYLHLTLRRCDLCSTGRAENVGERERADVRGFPGAESESVSGDQTRGQQRVISYQEPGSETQISLDTNSLHLLRYSGTQDTQSGELARESVKLQSGSHLTLE